MADEWGPRARTALIGVLIGCAGIARAEFDPSLQQRELLLFAEPVVSAAVKHPQAASDAPAAVTVVTREEIRRFGYRTLAEVLRSVRGFYTSGDRNYDYLGVRGFQRPSDYNDRILLLVNGHSYNDDIYQSAPVGYEFGIDLENVERIEVIRGPGSALYGGNALFAVINVVTLSGNDEPGVHLLAETGSFARKRGQIRVGHVFENGLSLFASGSVLDVDGQHELFYPEYDSPETNNGVARDADAEQVVNFFLLAQYGKFTLQGGANRREKHIPTGAFGTTFDDPGTKTVDKRPFAELSYVDEPWRDVVVSARAFYDGYRYDGTYIYGADGEREKNKDRASSDWFGGELRGRWQVLPSNALTIGTEYTYHPGATQENFNINGLTLIDDTRSFAAWGVYAQDEWTVWRNLNLIAGLRYDRSYAGDDEVSPRAALVWSPLVTTRCKLLYGRAFRAANLFERYYAYDAEGSVSLSNPDLNPERIATYEAVWEQALWGIDGTVAVYHYDLDNLIEQTEVASSDPDVSVIQYQNVSSARANGVELEARVPLPLGISGRAYYTLQEARAAGGRQLSNSPTHLGNVAALFPLPYGVRGGAELQVVGPRQTLDDQELNTVVLANLNFVYASPIAGLGATIGFYNIFDRSYADPGAAEHVQDRLEQDGFTFRFQVLYAF